MAGDCPIVGATRHPVKEMQGAFKETEIGPIPVVWEVAQLAQAKANVEVNAVLEAGL